jgi:phage gpG-like protein
MNATLTIDEPAFLNSIMAEFQNVKVSCQAAMANAFATVVNHNFGQDGEDRPTAWPALGKSYAIDYHDGDRTPTLQLYGNLQASIDIEEGNPEYASVFTNNPYADLQQFGGESEQGFRIPARPFFPIVGNEITPYTTQKCVDACEVELTRSLK